MPYDSLLKEAHQHKIDIHEKPMPHTTKGLYADNVIWINKLITTTNEKYCVLAEELGHYHTTEGNILNQNDLMNRKQEKLARSWAYKKLVPIEKIVDAYKEGINNKYELAEFIGVTESFLLDAISRYKEEFGTHTTIDNYVVYFEPLGVLELF